MAELCANIRHYMTNVSAVIRHQMAERALMRQAKAEVNAVISNKDTQ